MSKAPETMSREELIAEVTTLRATHAQAMRQLDAMAVEHSGRTLNELDDRLSNTMRLNVEIMKRAKAAEAENAKLRAVLERADDMANALVVYFNKRGVSHSMRKGNEDIGALADALSNYGPLRLAEMDARQRDIVQGITERRAALASEKGA